MHLFTIRKDKYSLSGIFKVPIAFLSEYYLRLSEPESVSSNCEASSPCTLFFVHLSVLAMRSWGRGENDSDM